MLVTAACMLRTQHSPTAQPRAALVRALIARPDCAAPARRQRPCCCRYFVAPKAEIVSELTSKVSATDADLEGLKSQKEAVERKMQETENELRELVRASPSIVRKLGNVRIG